MDKGRINRKVRWLIGIFIASLIVFGLYKLTGILSVQVSTKSFQSAIQEHIQAGASHFGR